MRLYNKKIIATSYLGLFIMLLLIINSALYTHIQKLDNGRIIVHAHPYEKDKNPPKNHNHAANDVLISSNISILYIIGKCIVSLTENKYRKVEIKYDSISLLCSTNIVKNVRGPPMINRLISLIFIKDTLIPHKTQNYYTVKGMNEAKIAKNEKTHNNYINTNKYSISIC